MQLPNGAAANAPRGRARRRPARIVKFDQRGVIVMSVDARYMSAIHVRYMSA